MGVYCELGQVALQPGSEVVLESARGERPSRVDVMVARNDRHVGRVEPELAFEDVSRQRVLGLEREVRQVSRDDDVIDPRARDLAGDRPHVLRAVTVPAPVPEV